MRLLTIVAALFAASTVSMAQDIKLIVRGDDMGSFHSANEAFVATINEGVVSSVEVMCNSAWFPQAARYLNEKCPQVDVGVHLTLTSEWEGVKNRPLTDAKTLVDENGYFFPFMYARNDMEVNYPALCDQKYSLAEIEAEYRAQIEMVKKMIPRTSHLSFHMGMPMDAFPLLDKLAKEYDMYINTESVKYFAVPLNNKMSGEQRAKIFADAIEKLEPGVYMFVEHPAYDTPEMRAVGHVGYEHVATDRQAVTEMFLSPVVKAAIERKGVKLIGYRDLK